MKKILVLEDEANIRSFVVINLNRAGYETIEAGSGEEALEQLRLNPDVGVALLDIMLPDMDGFEVCRRIRAGNSKIGIIMLIGIVKKNAIMVLDFSLEAERKEHLAPEEAVIKGCLVRFRPILMTTLAAVMGALPLAIGMGATGADMRRPNGICVAGGLIFSQIVTLYITPVYYVYLDHFGNWTTRKLRRILRGSLAEAPDTEG